MAVMSFGYVRPNVARTTAVLHVMPPNYDRLITLLGLLALTYETVATLCVERWREADVATKEGLCADFADYMRTVPGYYVNVSGFRSLNLSPSNYPM